MALYRYLMNPFFTVTTGNFKRALLMARDHRDKLFILSPTDNEIAMLYGEFNPIFTAYEDAYSKVHSTEGKYRGHTQIFEQLIQELSGTKIKEWDIKTQAVFIEGTPEYRMLFPQYRKPFQAGAYELRIDAVKSLADGMTEFSQLDNVRTDVEAFLSKLNAARTKQQGVESLDTISRHVLEERRIELAAAMHRVFGFLLYKHFKNTKEVERYYEMKYLQTPSVKNTTSFDKKKVSANSRITLFDGQLTANSFITIKNTGTVAFKVFTSTDTNALLPEDAMEIEPSQTQSFFANELGDESGFNWLMVVNESNQEAAFEIAKEEAELE